MLTHKQAEVHRFIFEHCRHSGYSPTLAEIRHGCGLAEKSNVHRLLKCIEERGYITWVKHKQRSIRVLRKPILKHTQYFKWDTETQKLIPLEKI